MMSRMKESKVPKAYIVSCYQEIRDPEKLAAYGKLAGPAMKAKGARVLARGGLVKSLEGGFEERTVIAEFDSFEDALAACNSPDYQAAKAALGDGVLRDMRIVEGID